MKFIHTADLHIGKMLCEFSLLKDQQYVLNQLIQIIEEEGAHALIIAGDVYDRSIPPADAVAVFDDFLTTVASMGVQVFMVSGNHDSPERVGFASGILEKKGVYIAGTFEHPIRKVALEDDFGIVNCYLLPFAKPPVMKHGLGEETDKTMISYHDAVNEVLKMQKVNKKSRNLLVTHHFVTNGGILPEQSDSENGISVGGVDQVDATVFDDFDYVALGHIHRSQQVKRETIRYAGSPIKYSFSEAFHTKSVTVIEMRQKGDVLISTRELKPLHELRLIKGKLMDLIKDDVISTVDTKDYIQATLTDECELMDALGTLRSVYPNVMQLILEKHIHVDEAMSAPSSNIRTKSTLEIYREFYESVTGAEFDSKREAVIREAIETVES